MWLSLSPGEIEGLPEGPEYGHWDGEEELPPGIEDVEFFVPPYVKGERAVPLLRRMRRLRVVQTLTAGVDNLLPHIPDGVTLCNARGVHEASTAELALTLVLSSLRGVPRFVRGQDAERWYAGFYPALADRTVLIVGYGAIGSAIEDRLTPFECDVERVARTARTTERGPVRPHDDLPHLLPRADVVIVVTPLTEATRGLVDAGFLARMKDGALLVNVSRGAVVDTGALLRELEAGRLHAAVDVTDPEPLPPGHPLWHAPNILISPHVGGSSTAFLPRARRLVRAQVRRYLSEEPLENVIVMS
ncbi:dihydrofolate reductase [Wenjunlia vitaminophila]|uniref:Dihydrofolate reductase n=1 Tax=Wenjunlia vitaminophila TaxID=76728 RepID=A0A0T6LU13_WENVI|nr:dihydrofolate reductase [Wenjunlia vitaminophila]